MSRWVWIVVALLSAVLLWMGRGTGAPDDDGGGGGGLGTVPALGCALAPAVHGGAPVQSGVPSTVRPFRHGNFMLSPLAGFSVDARVLSREDYSSGAEAALSPTDLALGWQRMSDPAVYERLGVTQAGRWYRYEWDADGPPIPLQEIVRSSANMHMIPADAEIARALADIRPDQHVRLQGWLVEARRGDGWMWRSSLTREDTGAGACEVVYVCSLSAY